MNVVFDLGGVVVRWDPDNILEQVFEAEDTRGVVRREIFEHADWVELDRGSIAFDEAVDRGAARTGLPPGEVARLLDFVPRSLTPFEETVAIIRSVRAAGHGVFARCVRADA